MFLLRRVLVIGTAAGAVVIAACSDGSTPLNVVPMEPVAHEVVSGGDRQAATIGTAVAEPPTVRVRDAYGNPVPGVAVTFTVTAGGGSVRPATDTTDLRGVATTDWTLGTAVGENALAAEIAGLPTVAFTAQASEPNNLLIDGMHLTQAVQSYDGAVPLVADRDGVLRIFVRAEEPNEYRPEVRVRFHHGGTLVREETIAAPGPTVPTSIDEGSASAVWTMPVPGELIRPGLAITADVDPENAYLELNESDNVFPASGSGTLDVRMLPDFAVRLVPIHLPEHDATGDVDEGNMHEYLVDAQKMFPFPGYDVDVRSPFTIDVDGLGTTDQWREMLLAIKQLRLAEGSARYYYGIAPAIRGSQWCGYGYIRGPRDSDHAAAVGLDACGAETAAHEWGHNFGRLHVQCAGSEGSPDPEYPTEYGGGSIGAVGLDVATGHLKRPDVYKDLMSYCQPEWISDYTYDAIVRFRQEEAAAGAAAYAAAPEPTIVVAGRIRDGRVELKPSFETTTAPVLPRRAGPYRLDAIAEDGSSLVSLSFDAPRIDHDPDGERQFAFAVPVRMLSGARLDRLRLTAPGALPAEIRRPRASAALAPGVELSEAAPGRVRLRWDADAFPLVVVRHPRTGEILSLASGGSAVVRTGEAELDLRLSPGIGEQRRRVRVRIDSNDGLR